MPLRDALPPRARTVARKVVGRVRSVRDGVRDEVQERLSAPSANPTAWSRLEGPVLVLTACDVAGRDLPERLQRPDVTQRAVGDVELALVDREAWGSVVLCAVGRDDLRSCVHQVPEALYTKIVAVWVATSTFPMPLLPGGTVPPAREVVGQHLAEPERGSISIFRFNRNVDAKDVLTLVARQSVSSADRGVPELYVGYLEAEPVSGVQGKPLQVAAGVDAVHPDLVVPVDVLVTSEEAVADLDDLTAHHVVDRAPVVVTEPQLRPVDELVFNPIGFSKRAEKPVVSLGRLVGVAGVTDSSVRRSRRRVGVSVDLATDAPRDVLRLAMAGVPLVAAGSQPLFAPELSKILAETPDLEDPLTREGYSVRLRRAAFDHHSTLAWRAGAARQAGVERGRRSVNGLPAVSVLLATKRPHELEGAVKRVAAQEGVDCELVVAAHGFTADAAQIAEWLGRAAVVLEFGSDVFFGDVLTGAARAASCDVVMKMDDDDWYSPHALHDLLMARRYSGADLVGMPAEFVHLKAQGLDETVRRVGRNEAFTKWVAGGTLTLSRSLLLETGGFRPVRRWVDAQLLARVLGDGGTIYRTHGLDYVLQRQDEGHTWVTDAESFKSPELVDQIWPGYRLPVEGL